ncbi:hypothetical protein HZH68_000175 [Vespula germanica]|uniref:Odorant receptor n=1 Tax=Vespula germanica TaxID=30212 RepID=A0A834NT94_VESGE|nr:hypothetical protein HZH68_000175 [Vespula germanica]
MRKLYVEEHKILDSQTSTMTLFESHYYKLNRELLLLIGLWPYQDPKASRFRTSIVNVLNMITSKFNMDLLMNNFMFFLPYLCIIAVYCTAYINKKEIRLLADHIKCDWDKLKPDELKIVEKYADQSRLITRILISIPIILQDIMPENNNYTYELIYPVELLIIEKEKNPYAILIISNLMQASNDLKSLTMTAICTLHMSGMIIWTLFNCIIGQRVLNHSYIVFNKTCTIPWYLFSPRLQKLAMLMLMRSMRPSYLSIGKMFVSSHTFFSSMNVIWNRIEYDWNELITTRGINILKEYASTSKLYNIILIGLYYVSVIFLIFQTILPTFLDVVLPLNESRPLNSPILMDSLIKQTIYFYPTLASTYVLLVFFGVVTTAVNGFFVVCVQHACAMFRLVRYTLDEAFENVDQKLYVNEENERISVDILQLLRIESIEENLEDALMCIFHLFGSFGWGLMGNMLCQSIIDHSSATFDQA